MSTETTLLFVDLGTQARNESLLYAWLQRVKERTCDVAREVDRARDVDDACSKALGQLGAALRRLRVKEAPSTAYAWGPFVCVEFSGGHGQLLEPLMKAHVPLRPVKLKALYAYELGEELAEHGRKLAICRLDREGPEEDIAEAEAWFYRDMHGVGANNPQRDPRVKPRTPPSSWKPGAGTWRYVRPETSSAKPKATNGTALLNRKQLEKKVREAVRKGRLGFLRQVLDAGLDVNTPTLGGYTPLLLALDEIHLRKPNARRESEVVGLLLERGADPNLLAGSESVYRPLARAASLGRPHLVKLLLAAGASPNRIKKREEHPGEAAVMGINGTGDGYRREGDFVACAKLIMAAGGRLGEGRDGAALMEIASAMVEDYELSKLRALLQMIEKGRSVAGA